MVRRDGGGGVLHGMEMNCMPGAVVKGGSQRGPGALTSEITADKDNMSRR